VVATAKTGSSRQEVPFTGLAIALAVQDPGNLGTIIIRTAATTDASGLWLSADSVVDNPKVLRASAGQWFQLPMAVILVNDCARVSAGRNTVIRNSASTKLTYWEVDWRYPRV